MKVIKILNTDDLGYPALLELRNTVLRKPLGLDIGNDDLSDESECQHLAYYSESGQMLGCLKIKQLESTVFKILQMAVLPEYQGKGIGMLLLKEAESLIRGQGGAQVLVDARAYAIPFYRNNGYRITGDLFEKINILHQRMIKPV